MSAGREFHVCGAATEYARRASSVRTRGTVSSEATDDRRGRAGAAVVLLYRCTIPGDNQRRKHDAGLHLIRPLGRPRRSVSILRSYSLCLMFGFT